MSGSEASIRNLLNAQTGKVNWAELTRHFARGALVCVAHSEDLIGIAEKLVQDSKGAVERLHAEGKLHRADDNDAIRWQQDDAGFWAVVVAPWVLVQEIRLEGGYSE